MFVPATDGKRDESIYKTPKREMDITDFLIIDIRELSCENMI